MRRKETRAKVRSEPGSPGRSIVSLPFSTRVGPLITIFAKFASDKEGVQPLKGKYKYNSQ